MTTTLNKYGDQPILLAAGHGADIASQRADDLNMMAIDHARSRSSVFAIDIACGAGGQSLRLAQEGALPCPEYTKTRPRSPARTPTGLGEKSAVFCPGNLHTHYGDGHASPLNQPLDSRHFR